MLKIFFLIFMLCLVEDVSVAKKAPPVIPCRLLTPHTRPGCQGECCGRREMPLRSVEASGTLA